MNIGYRLVQPPVVEHMPEAEGRDIKLGNKKGLFEFSLDVFLSDQFQGEIFERETEIKPQNSKIIQNRQIIPGEIHFVESAYVDMFVIKMAEELCHDLEQFRVPSSG